MDYYSQIRSIVSHRLYEKSHVDDLVQAIFLVAWLRLDKLKEHPVHNAWLIRIALNKIKQHNHKTMNKREDSYADIIAIDEGCKNEEDDILDDMKPDDKAILSLFYIQEQSVREIARALMISEGAVKVRLSRARKRFKAILENKGKSIS